MFATPLRRTAAAIVALLTAATVLGLPNPVAAATLTVTTTADGGAGSLREAFAIASGNAEADEIVLQAGETYVLDDCAEGDLDHAAGDSLTITGNGATVQQTCEGERVIESDGDLELVDITVTGGDQAGGLGGGVEADIASVSLTRVTIAGNSASTGGGVAAIRVTAVASTISGNSASSTGGGVWADQTFTATNSTVAGNTAATSGGGIAVVNDAVTLIFATVAANTAPLGSNVQVQAGGDELVAFASVIAAPTGGADCDLAGGVATTSQGANVSSDATCGFGSGAQDVIDAGDVGLGALGDNGGPTATMLPGAGSVLLDRADCAASPVAITSDQRGVSRPQGTACDTGAVEVEVAAGGPTTTSVPEEPSTTTTVPAEGAPLRLTG